MDIIIEIGKGVLFLLLVGVACFAAIVFIGLIDQPPPPTSGQQMAPGVDPNWRPERAKEVPPPSPPPSGRK